MLFRSADIYVTVATSVLAVLLLFYYKEEEIERIYRGQREGSDCGTEKV